MKKFSKAFTLTELLIALGVVAILCAVLMPVVNSLRPNQNILMAKRAYYTVQSVVSELINDDSCYPDKTLSVSDPRVGFDDYYGMEACRTTSAESGTAPSDADECEPSNDYNDNKLGWEGARHINANCGNDDQATRRQSWAAFDKFVRLFMDRLGVLDSQYINSGECVPGLTKCRFRTKDGMTWVFNQDTTVKRLDSDPSGNFLTPTPNATNAALLAGGHIRLTVDVNGNAKGPNCATDTISYNGDGSFGEQAGDSTCTGRTAGFDRFRMIIRGNGQIEIDPTNTWAQEAVTVDKNITDD